MIRTILIVALTFGALTPLTAQTVVYVLRHAEKVDDGTRNPPLSEAGKARAAAFADRLADEKIVAIYSTEYERTRATVRPLAEKLGLEITAYAPVDFAGLAERVQSVEGTVVIVGHSNTVIPIVQALGGEASGEIPESEYGRIYRLVIEGNTVTTAAQADTADG